MKTSILKLSAYLTFVAIIISLFFKPIISGTAIAKMKESKNLTEVMYLLDELECDFSYDEKTDEFLKISLKNNGVCNIYNWCITYESDYTIEKCENAIIICNNNVKQLKFSEETAVLRPNDTIILSLKITCPNGYNGEMKVRKYGKYNKNELYSKSVNTNDLKENVDVICYDSETKQTNLIIFDNHFSNNNRNCSKEYVVNKNANSKEDNNSPKAIIGGENLDYVNNVTTNPYCRIAHLYTDEPLASGNDHSRCTGFMVSNKFMLTSAHVVYTYIENDGVITCNEAVDGVTAYFEANGSSYLMKKTAKRWYWSSSYPTDPVTENDWGAIEFNDNIGSSTGWFSIGYASDTTLNNKHFRVSGYPIPKMTNNPISPIHQNNVYMYKSDSNLYGLETYIIKYTADTLHGHSGSPVWDTLSKTVYGIHSRPFVNSSDVYIYNAGRRITKSLFDMMEDNGWIN